MFLESYLNEEGTKQNLTHFYLKLFKYGLGHVKNRNGNVFTKLTDIVPMTLQPWNIDVFYELKEKCLQHFQNKKGQYSEEIENIQKTELKIKYFLEEIPFYFLKHSNNYVANICEILKKLHERKPLLREEFTELNSLNTDDYYFNRSFIELMVPNLNDLKDFKLFLDFYSEIGEKEDILKKPDILILNNEILKFIIEDMDLNYVYTGLNIKSKNKLPNESMTFKEYMENFIERCSIENQEEISPEGKERLVIFQKKLLLEKIENDLTSNSKIKKRI